MIYDWDVPEDNAFNYLKVCKSFVEDDSLFLNFKRDKSYQEILEHVNKEQSDLYISEMKDLDSLTEEQISQFRENDSIGNPVTFEYDQFGIMSPTTIRYIKNTLDIRNFLSGQKVDNILEIGGGYGGLCKTLSVLIDFENYMIIDLPEVNQLSEKYLSNFENLRGKTSQSFYDEIASVEGIDLLISNYAYSECTFDLQKSYYDNIIVNADKFYITYNNISTKNMTSDYFIEYASKDFEIKVEEEVRKCHTNFILYGTKIG
jgi:putative sugar O-methyltransferase